MTTDQTVRDDDAHGGGIDPAFGDAPSGASLAETIRDQPEAATRETTAHGNSQAFAAERLVPVPPGLDLDSRYHDQGFLGRGSGGEVHAIGDRLLDRSVAVKLVYQTSANDPHRLGRFLTEARITAGLEHPNILPVYDLGRAADGRWWFTMRRAQGITLAEAIQAHDSRLTRLEDRVQILLRICDAVAYAHGRGVIHRDLKPSNILLGDFGEVIVADWGTARRVDDAVTPGRLIGTPLYMSPEQARWEAADARSDVYALGLILAELVLKRLPIAIDVEQNVFWANKRQGTVDLPARDGLDGALLEIAAQALAPDPADRHADAGILRQALQEFLRHQESLALAQRAEGELQALLADGDHRGFARVVEHFRHACGLWAGNRRAAAGLLRAQAAQARFALDHGDIDLALAVLDETADEHAALRAEVQAAQRRRLESQRRGRNLRGGLAVVAALLLVTVAALVWEYTARLGAWITVFHRNLLGESVDLSGIAFLGRKSELLPIEELTHDPGEGILLPAEHWLWLDVRERGDVRLEVEARWPERVEGLELVLHARREVPPLWWNVPQGISCQFGGYQGDNNYLSENPIAGEPNLANNMRLRFEPGRTYRFALEIAGESMSISSEGRILVSQPRILTIGDAANHGIGIRAWSDIHLRRITVKRLRPPEHASPTLAGDALVARGSIRAGIDHYLALAEDFSGRSVAEKALVHACLAAARLDDGLAEQGILLERLRRLGPDPRRLLMCEESLVLSTWRAGRHAEALDHLDDLRRRLPGTRIVLALAERRPVRLPSEVGRRLASALAAVPDRVRLDLRGLGLTDLDFLRGVTVYHLLLSGNHVHDLEPLRGAGLTLLDISGCSVGSLAPLAGMPLRELEAAGNPLSDLGPLAGMPLEKVNLERTSVADLEPLRGAPLTQVNLAATAVADLEPLRGAPLIQANLAHTQVRNVAPIAQAALKILRASHCVDIDLSPLARCAELRELDLTACGLHDLSALSDTQVARLTLTDNSDLADLSPLAGMHLQSLSCARTAVTDLGPLRGQVALRSLFIAGTHVEDLGPLADSPLVELDCSDTPVTDLSVLAGKPVKRLYAHPTAARDLGVLASLPDLANLDLAAPELSAADFAAIEADLREAGREHLAIQLRSVRAWAMGDIADLRQQARPINGIQRLVMPVRLTLEDHRALAARLGAHLMVVRDQTDDRALCHAMGYGQAVWLDVIRDDQGWLHWATGAPLGYQRPLGVKNMASGRHFLALDVGNGGMVWYASEQADLKMPAIYEWPESSGSP